MPPTPTPPRPRSRSAFAAAFLSLIFPGLGHAYAGAVTRGLAFAAVPFLSLALLGGIVLRANKLELLGVVIQPGVLAGLLLLNVIVLVYRVVAVIDAWRVARFLNEVDASGGGRLGRARLPVAPLSIAGLLAVLLVLVAGHIAVARYNVLAMDFVGCVFTTTESADCELANESPSPGTSGEPSSTPGQEPSDLPTPIGTADGGTPAPTLPPWDGKERLNILLIGSDQRPNETAFNTDTLIVVSVDPTTKQVAMFQIPRDTVDVPVPAQARSVWGRTYGGKINSWFQQNRGRTDLWQGTSKTRGFNALKAILGELYGLDIRYYVEVNFQGFIKVVDTIGGVQVNVQIPVSDDRFPDPAGLLRRVYIPSGPQHMTGAEALIYARSRHSSDDFDRGRRQQRVLISLREQLNAQAVIANLQELSNVLKRSVSTDVPITLMPQLLALADGVDTKNIRSYVFAPPFYGTAINAPIYKIEPKIDLIRAAVRDAFTADPALEALRERLGVEAARVWVLNQSGRSGLASQLAAYLGFNGLDASAPNQRPSGLLSTTRIVVYNGGEARIPETIAYLEKLFGVKSTTRNDPGIAVDVVVTAGRNTPDLAVEPPG